MLKGKKNIVHFSVKLEYSMQMYARRSKENKNDEEKPTISPNYIHSI